MKIFELVQRIDVEIKEAQGMTRRLQSLKAGVLAACQGQLRVQGKPRGRKCRKTTTTAAA